MISGIHHVGITVADLDTSLAFYRDVLGFEVLTDRRGVDLPHIRTLLGYPDAVLNVSRLAIPGGGQLELTEFVSPNARDKQTEPIDVPTLHLAFAVSDMDAVVGRLRDSGVRFTSQVVDAPDGPSKGMRFVYCRDLDGAQLELVQAAA
jgi:catechol 2,3-dioxygenase-like lactoylglutathione lyase family enzyme